MNTFFGNLLICDTTHKDAVFLVPRVKLIHTLDPSGHIVREHYVYNAETGAVITDIGEGEKS